MKERKEQAQEMLRCLLLHLPPTLRIFLGPVDLGLLIFLVHIACKEFLLADRGQESNRAISAQSSNHTSTSPCGMELSLNAKNYVLGFWTPASSPWRLSYLISGKPSQFIRRREHRKWKSKGAENLSHLPRQTLGKYVENQKQPFVQLPWRIHYPGSAPLGNIVGQVVMTNCWFRPQTPGTGFP